MKNSSVEKDLALCEKYGYDYIELRLDMLKAYLQNHTLDDLKEYFSQHKIKPLALNSIEQINFSSAKEWAELIELFTFGCEVAQAIDNPYIVIVPTMRDDMRQKNEKEVLEDSVQAINKLADIAEGYGVKLAFEPIGDLRWCCRSLRQGLEIVQAVNRDSVGLVVDCINFYLHDKAADVDFISKVPLEKVFVFHINDCDDLPLGILDHKDRIMPGQGVIPIQDIVDRLKGIGFTGPASLELFRPEYYAMDAEEVIKMGAESCRPYL